MQATQEARVEFLEKTLESDKKIAEKVTVEADDPEEPTTAEIAAAIAAVYADSISNGTDGVNDLLSAVGNAEIKTTQSDALNQAIIDEETAALDKTITTAQAEVAKTTGLQKAIAGVESAQADLKASLEAQVEANVALQSALAAFNTANDSDAVTTYGAIIFNAYAEGDEDLTALSTTVNTVLVATTDGPVLEITPKGKIIIASRAAEDKKVAELLAAVQAHVASLQAVVSETDGLADAVAQVLALEGQFKLTTETVDVTNTGSTGSDINGANIYLKDGKAYAAVEDSGDFSFYALKNLQVTVDPSTKAISLMCCGTRPLLCHCTL